MSHNWGYVIVGYSITAVSLGGYFTWIRLRSRKLRRAIEDETRE
ncbi:MAG TPA: hypothetical protein VGP92_12310 [Acidimicrobiia bacterium]|jgi:hypothetical protein|nr:hypothetical protein [Acidimicrobiia bacterium]